MSWLVPKLRYRIHIQKPVQSANSDGGFDREYETITTIYAGMNIIPEYGTYIRGQSIDDKIFTHEFIVRYSAIKNIGKGFSSGFANGFDSLEDLNPLKSDYFIFLKDGSNVKGRLFQIINIQRDDERKEWFKFKVKEIEERGTGYAP